MCVLHPIRALVLACASLCAAAVQSAEFLGLDQLQGDTDSGAVSVSADGTVVVGWSEGYISPQDFSISRQAFRWTEADGMVGLGYLPGGTWSSAHEISADGAVVVGGSYTDISNEAFRWTEAGGMVGLGYLPGGWSSAKGVSADGAVVVGSNRMDIGTQAFRWTEAGGMVGLGYLPGGAYSSAYGVSADGAVVVGRSDIEIGDQTFSSQAIRWTEDDGMESIELLLLSSIGLTSWRLESAYGASKDGSVIVGQGRNPDGNDEAWIADIGDVPPLPTNPIDISGTIKTANNVDICAMVLASGRFTFSCNPPGEFSLADVPRENNRTVKRQIYADGFLPEIDILTNSTDEAVAMTYSGDCPSYNTPYDPGFFPDAAGKKIDISGIVLLQDTVIPICGMVLANGQYKFTCDGSGESLFLRKLVLGIPAQASGKNLTRPLMPSAPRTSCVRAASPHHRKLGAGYTALPQMTGRRFGCNSRSPLALRTTGIQNYLRLPGTTSLRVRSPWLAAQVGMHCIYPLIPMDSSSCKSMPTDSHRQSRPLTSSRPSPLYAWRELWNASN